MANQPLLIGLEGEHNMRDIRLAVHLVSKGFIDKDDFFDAI